MSCIYQDKTLSAALIGSLETTNTPKFSSIKNKRHHNPDPKSLSQKLNIVIEKAKELLQNSTQDTVRTATGLLSHQYWPDMMQLGYRHLSNTWYTETLFSKVISICQHRCGQVFTKGSDIFFHPNHSKLQTDQALQTFLEDIGRPRLLKFDGACKQTEPSSSFMKLL